MDFYGLVEEWPDESLVVFRELPGCFSSSPTTEEAIQKAPEAIVEYLRWLKQNDVTILEEEIDSINVVRRGKVRRAKLYYLRNLRGKSARIVEKSERATAVGE